MAGGRKRYSWVGMLALAVLFALSGCAPTYLDPGPDPARLKLKLDLALNPAQIREAVRISRTRGGFPPPGAQYSDPFWQVAVSLLDPESGASALPPEKGQATEIRGAGFKGDVVFLAPPGIHDFRVTISAAIRRITTDPYPGRPWFGPGFHRYYPYAYPYPYYTDDLRWIPVTTFSRDLTLTLKPGAELALDPMRWREDSEAP